MNNFWLKTSAAFFVVLASFYAGRMSLDTTGKTSSEKEELSPTSEKRSATRKPSDQSASPRSAILRKSLIVRPSSVTSAEDRWVTFPRDEFIKLSKNKSFYDILLFSESSRFDKKLLDGFGFSDETRDILNASIGEFGKNVYELRNLNAQFKEGDDENEAVVDFGDYDDQLLPYQEKLRTDIRNALGEEQGKLFEEVAKLDSFFSDSKKMYSKSRLLLRRTATTYSSDGEEPKKHVRFSKSPQLWDEKNQRWSGNSSSGSNLPHGDNEVLFTNAGLYPWPEQGIIDE